MTRPSPLRGAPGLFLVTLLVTLLTPPLAGCGAASRDAVLSCSAPADCGAGAFCVQGACQASSPPVADFTPPPDLTTNRSVSVTATARDPDGGDAVAAWAWSITPVSAPCAADADVADAATLQAVFWCAGSYELTLVVTDTTGLESAPVRRTVAVTALPDAPSVTVGPPIAVEHRCAGAPLRCEPEQPIALAADGQSPLGGALTYRWTVLPPDASRAGATALLSPSATARNPALILSTDGGPISGAWRLRARVEDASGHLAQATQLVTVGNRPPVIDGTPLSLDHQFQGGAYLAGGTLAVPVVDPDGDPLQVGAELLEPAWSGCTSSLSGVAGASGTFALSCPTPAGLQAARLLRATAADVNGAAASARVALEIRNRLPVIRLKDAAAGLTGLELDHSVGPCPGGGGACFQVTGESPFLAEDPDGDPVTAVTLLPSVEPSRGASLAEVSGSAAFRFSTPVDRPAEFRAPDGTSGFTLSATAADPFGASAPAAPLAVRIRNRPPVVKTAAPAVTVGHRFDAAASQYQAVAQLALFEDPDGDPLLGAGSAGDESCKAVSLAAGQASVSCSRTFLPGAGGYPTLAGFAGDHQIRVLAADGWDSTGAVSTLTIGNTPPTLPPFTGAIEACYCSCAMWDGEFPNLCADIPVWAADPDHATFAVGPADLDGDPLAATFSSSAAVTPATWVGAPDACAATISSATFPVSVAVTVNDGVSQASATWTATAVVCAKAGQRCTTPTRR